MPVLTEAIRAALRTDPSSWTGGLRDRDRARLEGALLALPDDVCEAMLAGLLDPGRQLWARGGLHALRRAGDAGAVVVGMRTDELIELEDGAGVRFGVAPVDVPQPVSPFGAPGDVQPLLSVLDGIFGDRGYVVQVGQRIPENLDLAPIARAVRLWISKLGRGVHEELHAKFEDEHVCVDFTLLAQGYGGRMLTLGPVDALERLDALERRLAQVVSAHEESVGDLPLVIALCADRSWRLPRGYVQLQLYGPAQVVQARRTRAQGAYEAWFEPRPSAMFRDRVFQQLSSLWWTSPPRQPTRDPLGCTFCAHDNPWARVDLELDVAGRRFVVVDRAPDGTAHLRWLP